MTAITQQATAQSQSRPAGAVSSLSGDAFRGLIVGFLPIFSLVCEAPNLTRHLGFVAMNTVTATLMVIAGQYLLHQPHRRSFAVAMTVCGYLWAGQFATAWASSGPVPILAGLCSEMFYIVGASGILRYPDDSKTTPLESASIIYIAVSAAIQYVLAILSSIPTDFHLVDPWWTTNQALHDHRSVVLIVASVISFVGPIPFMVAVAKRAKRIPAMDRPVLLPLGIAASLVALFSVSLGPDQFFAHASTAWFANSAIVALVPLSVLVIFGLQDKVHAGIASSLSNEFSQQRLSELNITTLLRAALKDDSLEIHYWSELNQCFKTASGTSVNESGSQLFDYTKRLSYSDGSPLALVVGSAYLNRHAQIVETALNTSAVALENAKLHASLIAQLEEVTESRKRVVQAALAERQRIERDLHDGVQQRLLALAMRIGTAQYQQDSEKLNDLDWIRTELVATVSDVRDLARGIHPADLRQSGLKAAIDSVGKSLPFPIQVSGDSGPLSDAVAATAYFVACEALTNSVKHSVATRATVSLERIQDLLIVEIVDDGVGGARVTPKGGLRGLIDRVDTIRGKLVIESRSSKGTTIRAEIPCV